MAQQKLPYIESRRDIVKAIKRGLDDIEAGRTIAHEEAMRRIRTRIARAKTTAKPKPRSK